MPAADIAYLTADALSNLTKIVREMAVENEKLEHRISELEKRLNYLKVAGSLMP